jgi:hypothetical protein
LSLARPSPSPSCNGDSYAALPILATAAVFHLRLTTTPVQDRIRHRSALPQPPPTRRPCWKIHSASLDPSPPPASLPQAYFLCGVRFR